MSEHDGICGKCGGPIRPDVLTGTICSCAISPREEKVFADTIIAMIPKFRFNQRQFNSLMQKARGQIKRAPRRDREAILIRAIREAVHVCTSLRRG